MNPVVSRFLGTLLLSTSALLAVRGAETLPLYAAREALLCQTCHVDPNGGGIRNAFGFRYAMNRHSLQPESGKAWGELALTNRVGEEMPLTFGLNLRDLMIATTSTNADSLDRAGFFAMENALHVAFQPHPMLTTSMSWDFNSFFGSATLRDAYALVQGGPWNAYLKVGRLRVPYGLRTDDHTVATRNGFLDFTYGGLPVRFLPYDPRQVDNGVELGGASGIFYGRASYTNGSADPLRPLGNTRAQAKAIKLGVQVPHYQSGISLYDDFDSDPAATLRRATRWGYYGLTHLGPLAALGEVGAGTDRRAGGARVNLLAGFGELDWALMRSLNLRLRYDYLQTDRNDEANRHERVSVEGEWVPVPFGELRTSYRFIRHQDASLDDENQYYLQAHVSY